MQEVRNIPHERYVRSSLRLAGQPSNSPNDLAYITDNQGHGTQMVAAAAGNGRGYGVAPGAAVVEVLMFEDENLPLSPPEVVAEYIAECWGWAINDIKSKGRRGKAVLSMSYSKSSHPA